MEENGDEHPDPQPVKSLVIVFSYHHKNTEKIAHVMADVLGAQVKTPQQVTPDEIREYELVGFGSGIYSATVDASLLDLVCRLPQVTGKSAFIFSTYGAPAVVADREFVLKNHTEIREKLEAKGFTIVGEFGCAGWNTNSFLNLFGGLNKGRPDAGDLGNAETFARDLRAGHTTPAREKPGEKSS
jgi:flavodoxin